MPDALVRGLIVLAVVAGATVLGWVVQRRSGRVREGGGARFSAQQLEAVGLRPAGAEALALLLGSPTCAPCVTVKQILTEVAGRRPGFRWVYVDAADHLDLAEAHHVLRVPTLFVLDPGGRILARTSGVPAARDVLAVLDREGSFEGASAA